MSKPDKPTRAEINKLVVQLKSYAANFSDLDDGKTERELLLRAARMIQTLAHRKD